MIASLLFAQVMIETLDTRPQPAVPATAFRCTFIRTGSDPAQARFDLAGTIPAMPEGHDPNASFPMTLTSADNNMLAGRGVANSLRATDWFRDYQITRRVGTASYVVNLKLRRDSQSIAWLTLYDGNWPVDPQTGGEPYRYDAVALCATDFTPESAS